MIWIKLLSFFVIIALAGLFIYEGYFGKEAKEKSFPPSRVRAIILGPGLIIGAILGVVKEFSYPGTPIGIWQVRPACESYTLCEDCRKISFTEDGFITTRYTGRTEKIARWEVEDDQLKLVAFDNDSTFETGTYTIRYRTYSETTELALEGRQNSLCYELIRREIN